MNAHNHTCQARSVEGFCTRPESLILLTMPSLKSVQRELKLSMRQLTAVDAILKLYSRKSETNRTVVKCFESSLCRLLKSARGNKLMGRDTNIGTDLSESVPVNTGAFASVSFCAG